MKDVTNSSNQINQNNDDKKDLTLDEMCNLILGNLDSATTSIESTTKRLNAINDQASRFLAGLRALNGNLPSEPARKISAVIEMKRITIEIDGGSING